jgi:hypothetical protein
VAGLHHSASAVKETLALVDFNKNNGVDLRELLAFIDNNTVSDEGCMYCASQSV